MANRTLLPAQTTLNLLRELRDLQESFAERERQLQTEHNIATSNLRTERDQALEDTEEGLNDRADQVKADLLRRWQALETRYQQRKQRIAHGYAASRERLQARIQAKEGQGRYDKQRSEILVNRECDAELAGTSAHYEELASAYAGHYETWKKLNQGARRALGGFVVLSGKLSRERRKQGSETVSEDLTEGLGRAELLAREASQQLAAFRHRPAVQFFSAMPPQLMLGLILIVHGALAYASYHLGGVQPLQLSILGGSAVICFLGLIIGNLAAGTGLKGDAEKLTTTLGELHSLTRRGTTGLEAEREKALAAVRQKYETEVSQLESRSEQAIAQAQELRNTTPQLLDQQRDRVQAKLEAWHKQASAALEREQETAEDRLNSGQSQRVQEISQTFETKMSALEEAHRREWETAVTEWKARTEAIRSALAASADTAREWFPDWSREYCESWSPPVEFRGAAKFGTITAKVKDLATKRPKDPRLAWEGEESIEAPLLVTIPDQGSLLVETGQEGRTEAIATLNDTILRLLASNPPGRISFTLLDPVAMGESFAGVMHLADYEEGLIHKKIWTQENQIEQRLGELNEHMEKVIQMYLRNEYESIAAYNQKAGNIAEKYHYLVIADFPSGFSDLAARRLQSIAASGHRCGVYTLIHWDRRHKLPPELPPEDLRKSSAAFQFEGGHFEPVSEPKAGIILNLESPPPGDYAIPFIHRLGKASLDSERVEVPFSYVAPEEGQLWSLDTTQELRVPIGRTGATKLQELAIGKGTRQHVLIAGKTGSGKSTLFHVMITNLALWYSPDQVEFYLIDFKKGVEFKAYATRRIPHVRVVAIESDREFGLSVLQRVDEELRRRGEKFRAVGAQDIEGYKRAGGGDPIPRTMLMIDEFQEFFVEDDAISQNAAVLLDRIVRQGRAFGIHVILGSQTLGGAFTLARATLGQMAIRIALQCEEADSYLILDDTNPAARLLTRPGEGIYNDASGKVESNSPFQVVWLPDEVRAGYLNQVVAKAEQSGRSGEAPVVFEGNVPAEVRENGVLAKHLAASTVTDSAIARIWLGSPNSIKGPTEAIFQRQSGNNLLVVGQRDDSISAMFGISLVALSTQFESGALRFILMDGTMPDSAERAFLDQVRGAIPHEIVEANNSNVDGILTELSAELQKRADGETGPTIFFMVQGLQKFRNLRYEEDYGFDSEAAPKPGAMFNTLIAEGPSHGIYILAACDTYNNVNRCLSRKALSEFEMRVVFQMSANDSAALIDTPKASSLGLNRALFYNEQAGYLETFRPYALPEAEWVRDVGEALRD